MNCPACGNINRSNVKFCSTCGKKVIAEEPGPDQQFHIRKITIFFFVLAAYITALNFLDAGGTYGMAFIFDGIFALIVLVFFALNFRRTIPLFRLKEFSAAPLVIIFLGLPLLALLVFWFGGIWNQEILNSSQASYSALFADSPLPLFFSILSVGVFPALFEEIAFRGILFDDLLKLTGKKATILITAILFTILHFSLISVLWIFPAGLFFGYLRARYNTLLYGMLGHFLYNSSIVLIEVISA